MMQCVAHGHEITALANLKPPQQSGKGMFERTLTLCSCTYQNFSDELDSYMYQTVGHDAIQYYAECMDVPLYRGEIQGTPIQQESNYVATPEDETEDLYKLLSEIVV